MCEHHRNAAPVVLIVSEHEKFAATASQQLRAHDYDVRTLSPEEALEALRFEGGSPLVALVDCDAGTAAGSPLRHTIHAVSPDCQIILVCTLDQASTGARLTRSGDVRDYLLTDSVRDPDRVLLLVERAGAKRLTGRSETGAQYRKVLQALAEMRDVLRDGSKNLTAKPLDGLEFETSANRPNHDLRQEAAGGYEDSLVEFISAGLRRLESQILLLADEKPRVAAGSPSSRVLVVEDDTISGEMVKHILERNGFDVVVARTGMAAKEALSKLPPDLVLMDIHLDDANGLELIKRLRAGSTCPNVPVIVTTSDRMRDTVLDAAGVNVQGYLLKPYRPDLLVQKVKAVLATSKAEPSDSVGSSHPCPT